MEILKMDKYARRNHLVSALTERRKHPRVPLRLPTEYGLEGTTRSRLCHTINISEGGILLFLPERLEVGRKLKVEVYYYFDYELAKFGAVAEVVWVGSFEDSPAGYRSALEFFDLSLRDFEKLKGFLRKIFS